MCIANQIRVGLAELPLSFDERLVDGLTVFIEELVRWNRVFNLTAIRSPVDMVGYHLMDSLSIAPFLTGRNILDVGSGAGLPGLPLAIFYPEKKFILLDSNGKKVRFMTQVVINLGLVNVEVVQTRVEDYVEADFDHVLCRAFAPLATVVEKVSHLVGRGGSLLAMTGKIDEDSGLGSKAHLRVKRIVAVEVPLVEGQRCLVELVARNRS